MRLNRDNGYGLELVLFLVFTILAIYFKIMWFLIPFVAIFIFFYFISLLFKTLIFTYRKGKENVFVTKKNLSLLNAQDLPIVTVLVPLYREKTMVADLIKTLKKQNYPREKLDIKFLLEKDDPDTIKAVNRLHLSDYLEILIVDSKPKTKPAALQVGLEKARGEILVVYDAEDRPAKDQILKSVFAFQALDPEVICIQSPLHLRGSRANFLTRFFSAEYFNHYGLYLPFLVRADLVVPLGGTSNFFRIKYLKELGGWDPYNVTEDADLGVRISRAGYKVKILNSSTSEEANARFDNWLRQRSRWIKGYFQTWFNHIGSPLTLYKDLGVSKFITFHIIFGLGPLFNLINPLFWFMTFYYFATRAVFIESLFPPIIFYPAIVCTLGNIVFIVIQMTACMKMREYDKVPLMLLTPFYWFLISIAAWYGFYQLLTRPHYWEKTEHGLALYKSPAIPSGYRK